MGWIEHGDASYIEMKNQDIAELRAKIAALEAENGRLRDALKSAAPVINCLDVYGRYLPVRYLIADALAQQPSPAQDKEQG